MNPWRARGSLTNGECQFDSAKSSQLWIDCGSLNSVARRERQGYTRGLGKVSVVQEKHNHLLILYFSLHKPDLGLILQDQKIGTYSGHTFVSH